MDLGTKLDAALRSFQERAAKAAELKERIAGLRGSARNADGSVTVTVAPSGAVLGLQLGPRAMQRSHTALQQEILTAIRDATKQASAALDKSVEPILGERTEQFREAFNAHVEPLVPDAPPPAETPARPRPPAEDDDFGGSILRRERF